MLVTDMSLQYTGMHMDIIYIVTTIASRHINSRKLLYYRVSFGFSTKAFACDTDSFTDNLNPQLTTVYGARRRTASVMQHSAKRHVCSFDLRPRVATTTACKR